MFLNFRRSIILTAFGSAFCASAATTAVADIIQLPAVAFTQRESSDLPGVANAGTLTTAQGKYYAAVPFPFSSNGDFVCSFKLIHRDNDADSEINARLFRKRIIVGDNPFAAPIQMARARTGIADSTAGVAVETDITIGSNRLTLTTAFYYVELEFGSNLLEALGVQIEYAPVC
jgi:hypothetical protein